MLRMRKMRNNQLIAGRGGLVIASHAEDEENEE